MKRLYKYIMALILILFITSAGFTADLYGTYDQRIKLTIDHRGFINCSRVRRYSKFNL